MDNRAREIGLQKYSFEDDGRIPNNLGLPLLVYPQALGGSELESSQYKERLASNGWEGVWVNGVFSYHHYHSNAHEVLCVVEGEASIAFGGPEGEAVEVAAGDIVVIPAGVGHKKEVSSSSFAVIGAYPRGQENYDLRTGEEGERPEVLENIRNVSLPDADPLFGEEGPLVQSMVRGSLRDCGSPNSGQPLAQFPQAPLSPAYRKPGLSAPRFSLSVEVAAGDAFKSPGRSPAARPPPRLAELCSSCSRTTRRPSWYPLEKLDAGR